MAQILDQHHDILLCYQCQKYLSFFPVKLYRDGKIKCGRCCKQNDEGVESLYQELAKNCLFKCVNWYEGCRRLLLPSEVPQHEQTCIGKSYNCPTCGSSQMSVLQLIEHFKQSHSNYFLPSNVFYVKLSENLQRYLYIQDHNIFFIFLHFTPSVKCFCISTVMLRELNNIKQRYVISVDSLSFKRVTPSQNCISLSKFNNDHYLKVDVSLILNQFVKLEIILDTSEASAVRSYELQPFSKPTLLTKGCQTNPNEKGTVQLSTKFRTTYPDYLLTVCGTALYCKGQLEQIKLTCSNCRQLLTLSMICASKQHSICLECIAWCWLCRNPNLRINYMLKSMSTLMTFPCKWKCGQQLPGNILTKHEADCTLNIRKCPVCQDIMKMKLLKKHLKLAHQSELVRISSLQEFFEDQLRSGDGRYFVINNNMFRLKWVICNDQLDLQITPCDKMTGLELLVVTTNECYKLDSWKVLVSLEDDPYFYLRHFPKYFK